MNKILAFGFAALLALPVAAQETTAATQDEPGGLTAWQNDPSMVFDATEIDLSQFQWIARPIVVFADTPADPRFQRQMDLIYDDISQLVERDVVVITDTDPQGFSAIREQLRPRGFMLAILGKDGTVLIRKPLPWDLREITRNIDKLPLRQQEIRDRRQEQRDLEAAEAAAD